MATEPSIEMLEKALNRWHKNLFPDTKNLTGEAKEQAVGKCSMIESVLWWIDAIRRGEVTK